MRGYHVGDDPVNTVGAGQGEAAGLENLVDATLRHMLHCHDDPVPAGHQVHGATHSFHHFALMERRENKSQ